MLKHMKTLWYRTNRWHRGFLLFFIVELRLVPGGQMGFTCNDPALSHPFNGDTITWKHLFATILLLPLAVMLIVERTFQRDKTIKPKQQALRWYREYVFGVLLNLTLVQSVKQLVGSPRPHFFDTCSPAEALTCQESEYVPRYTCTKAHWLTQSDRSFPSGHTGLALHAGFFLAYYLFKRSRRSNVTISAQVALLLATLYCAVSRMTDHRHHWWDVLGGAILGLPVLLYTIVYLCKDFETPREESESKPGTHSVHTDSNVPLVDTKEI